MKRFIENAKQQFLKFGSVRITYYPDRSYQNPEELNLNLNDAIDLIQSVILNECNDDIHVPHPNYFN